MENGLLREKLNTWGMGKNIAMPKNDVVDYRNEKKAIGSRMLLILDTLDATDLDQCRFASDLELGLAMGEDAFRIVNMKNEALDEQR